MSLHGPVMTTTSMTNQPTTRTRASSISSIGGTGGTASQTRRLSLRERRGFTLSLAAAARTLYDQAQAQSQSPTPTPHIHVSVAPSRGSGSAGSPSRTLAAGLNECSSDAARRVGDAGPQLPNRHQACALAQQGVFPGGRDADATPAI